MTTARELAKAIKSEAERAGVRVCFGHSAKHRTAVLDDGCRTSRMHFSSTPSFTSAVNQMRAEVRRRVLDVQRLREPVIAPSVEVGGTKYISRRHLNGSTPASEVLDPIENRGTDGLGANRKEVR
jgi:hypothetical protein